MPNIPDFVLNMIVCLDTKAASSNTQAAFTDEQVHSRPPRLKSGHLFVLRHALRAGAPLYYVELCYVRLCILYYGIVHYIIL